MKKTQYLKCFSIFFLLFLLFLMANQLAFAGKQYERILPTSNYFLNANRVPIAWEITKGKGVKIAIICSKKMAKLSSDWAKSIVPEVEIFVYEVPISEQSGECVKSIKKAVEDKSDVIVIEPNIFNEYDKIADEMSAAVKKNISVIIPVDNCGGAAEQSRINGLINKIEPLGVITTATTVEKDESRNSIKSIDYYKDLQVNIFTTAEGAWENYEPASMLSAVTVGATAALLKSKNHNYTPAEIKKIMLDSARNVWACVSQDDDNKDWEFIALSEKDLKKYNPKKYYNYKVLNIGKAVNSACDIDWLTNSINVSYLQKLATGKGITVAILDSYFKKDDPGLKDRIVFPGSVVQNGKLFTEFAAHGTWMAQTLVGIAPDVKIMPVCYSTGDVNPDSAARDDNLIKAIYYAIEHKADIISYSSRTILKEKIAEFDKALAEAVKAGIVPVFIHYNGDIPEVVSPGAVEGEPEREYSVFVLGASNDWKDVPWTMSVSDTAPAVAGVIALMKELNPKLTPAEIKKRLLEATALTQGDNKNKILDCSKLMK